MSPTRRSFIKYASLAAGGSTLALRPFGALNAMAQATTGYKALVCIFLYGGNDANNMLVPFDAQGYANYAKVRRSLAIPQKTLLQLGQLPTFAIHPSLTGLQTIFDGRAGAFVANVGTLNIPTTRAQYNAGSNLPDNLFSHADQQIEWQNAAQSAATQTGWAGRVSDLLNSNYNPTATIPMVTSVAGDTVFCNGQTSTPVSVTPGNTSGATCGETAGECAAQSEIAQSMLTFDSGLSLVQADNAITSNAYLYSKVLSNALASVSPLQTLFPSNNQLGSQLMQIAQIIQARAALGVQRQIFFAGIGSFDTHANQLSQQSPLLSQLSSAMSSFYQATGEIGLQNNVTTFTMSDFSRTLQPNTNGGSDHGWGAHHIVMGGAVQGGRMYGTFPSLTLGGPDDSGSNGRWVPSTGIVQYASTLASWFGVSPSQMATIFPNIAGFPTANLGFV
jgi:uncharacterized protein (DUF1501 family)